MLCIKRRVACHSSISSTQLNHRASLASSFIIIPHVQIPNMQLITLITLLAPAMVTVQAGCYSGGPKWSPNYDASRGFVDSICNKDGVAGSFGTNAGTKYRCTDLRDNVKGEFWVSWRGSGDGYLSDQNCKDGLKREIDGCQNGGESVYGQWYYR